MVDKRSVLSYIDGVDSTHANVVNIAKFRYDHPMKKKHRHTKKSVGGDIQKSEYELKQLQIRLMTLSQDKSMDRTRAGIMSQMAISYWKQYHADASINLWQQVISISREQRDEGLVTIAAMGLTNVYGQIDRTEESFEWARLALKNEPNNFNTMFTLGNAYHYAGDVENARIWWHHTVEAAPDFTFGFQSLADLYVQQGLYNEAQTYFDKAVELEPDDSSSYLLIGNMLSTQECYPEALENYQKAVRLNSKSAIPHHNLGNCHLRMGQLEKARRCFKKAIEIDDEDALYPNVAMGVLYRSHSNTNAQEKSVTFFQQALKISEIGKCRLKAEWMDYDSRGAIALTGLGDEQALSTWQRLLNTSEPRPMSYGLILDCVCAVRLMASCKNPPSHAKEILSMLEDALLASAPS